MVHVSFIRHLCRSGVGYSFPSEMLSRNRLRTARIWLDEYYELASRVLGGDDLDIGPIDAVGIDNGVLY